MESRAIKNPPPPQRGLPEISRTFRAAEWWEFKLSPMLATAYATAFLLKISILSLWPLLLLALVALAACAAYVSVINDLTDLEDDLASGKANCRPSSPRSEDESGRRRICGLPDQCSGWRTGASGREPCSREETSPNSIAL